MGSVDNILQDQDWFTSKAMPQWQIVVIGFDQAMATSSKPGADPRLHALPTNQQNGGPVVVQWCSLKWTPLPA